MELYIGVMSGTSLDGIDIVITDLSHQQVKLIAAKTYPFSEEIKQHLQKLINEPVCHLKELGNVDIALGEEIANSINQLLNEKNLTPAQVVAIGSHGQTVFHQPNEPNQFSLQIGNPNVIVEQTGITTVADFRQRDMVLGGQGAPLVPAFHQSLFQDSESNRVILNIGGISNITVLPAKQNSQKIFGFDTGPGNTLLDAWCQIHTQQPYDKGGKWAETGEVSEALLTECLKDNYFSQPIPKSTGREHFNLKWLNQQLEAIDETLSTADIQATLCQLTVESIANDIQRFSSDLEEVYVCGGGAYNTDLIHRLQAVLNPIKVISTNALGLSPEWVEATAFAWLAKQTINKKAVALADVTGARSNTLLGAVYYSSSEAS